MNQYYYSQYTNRSTSYAGAAGAGARAGSQEKRALLEAYATLWLRPGAPEPVVRAAYRSLAGYCHPDAGGDPEVMVRLNVAYAMIQRHLRDCGAEQP